MPTRRTTDPLVTLSVRVLESLRAKLEALAKVQNCSLSDALRSHLTLEAAKPLGKPAPRRRIAQRLASVSGADPELLRQWAAIGSNLNQIARVLNGQSLAAKPLQALELLTLLRSIELKVGALHDASNVAGVDVDAH